MQKNKWIFLPVVLFVLLVVSGKGYDAYQEQITAVRPESVENSELTPDSKPIHDINLTPMSESESVQAPASEPEPEPLEEHSYEVIGEDITWSQAVEEAQRRGGYLAEINNAEENCIIIDEIKKENANGKSYIRVWVGAQRTDSGLYDFQWLSGNKVTFADWRSDSHEPSGTDEDGNEENYVCLMIPSSQPDAEWKWNDVPEDILTVMPEAQGRIAYVVEYE